MWTPTNRAQYKRTGLGYGSSLTNDEWALLEPLLPPPRRCGRKRKWPMRLIVEAMFYILRAGCAWDMLPREFPPLSTVYRWFARFRDSGTPLRSISHHLDPAHRTLPIRFGMNSKLKGQFTLCRRSPRCTEALWIPTLLKAGA
jgi:transposase